MLRSAWFFMQAPDAENRGRLVNRLQANQVGFFREVK